ncbi:MAG TPA: HypC/HybG/HupF family hydrogenase formation chaperone [Bacillota bacterium]|nr:HypC/HybG/HupF family hydrogenase formation chaperone [Bacillota bacterium]HPU18477.1 HypC/HybG/HupF family hydrogenase formation chaperone [Bacillota bacterium]
MCIAIPGCVVAVELDEAEIDYGGVKKKASTCLCENVTPGDRVLVHAGFIIKVLSKDEGEELERLVAETMELFGP